MIPAQLAGHFQRSAKGQDECAKVRLWSLENFFQTNRGQPTKPAHSIAGKLCRFSSHVFIPAECSALTSSREAALLPDVALRHAGGDERDCQLCIGPGIVAHSGLCIFWPEWLYVID